MKRKALLCVCCLAVIVPLAAAADSVADLLRKAEELVKLEKLAAAEGLLLRARLAEPQNAGVHHQLGYVQFRQRRLGPAQIEFQAAVRVAPPALYSRYFLGRISLLQGRPEEAIRWLEPVAASETPVFDTRHQLALAQLAAGEFDRALENAQAALRESPWDGAVHYTLARVYHRLGQAQLAGEEFRTSQRLKAAGLDTAHRLLECAQHLEKAEKQEALEIGRQLTESEQVAPEALVALGVLYGNAALHAEALEPFRRAAERDPALFQAHYNTGLTLLKLGRTNEAEAPLRRAVELIPQSFDASSALALVYVAANRHREAIPLLESARRTRPGNPRILGLLGTAYLRTRSEKAVPVLRAAVRAAPQDSKFYFLLIEALQSGKDEYGALKVAQEVVRLFPGLAEAHLAVAQQLARMGRYQDAGRYFQTAAEMAPSNLSALLGLGEVLHKRADYEGSLAVYRRTLALEPQNLSAQLGVARNLALLGRLEEAREALERALPQHPQSASLRFELARVYTRLQEPEQAAEQTRIFQQLREKELAASDAGQSPEPP